MSFMMKKLLIFLIRLYKKYVSPLLPPLCRFYPSCSVYAMEAIEIHGACKGSLLAIGRLLRCNKYFPGGYDPVPPKREKHDLRHR